jgi:hypothetical protein
MSWYNRDAAQMKQNDDAKSSTAENAGDDAYRESWRPSSRGPPLKYKPNNWPSALSRAPRPTGFFVAIEREYETYMARPPVLA